MLSRHKTFDSRILLTLHYHANWNSALLEKEDSMRFCFIIEEQYKNEPMPLVIADQIAQWGHEVDLLEPTTQATNLSDLANQGYDAYVLKTISGGPGMSILESAEALGITTVNNSRAIRMVRDKAVAVAVARAYGFPVPPTYFVAHDSLLQKLPADIYPLVIKPCDGSSCQGIYHLESPDDLAKIDFSANDYRFLLAQRYAENPGFDIKLYVTGTEVYAVVKKSPLHPEVKEGLIPVTPQWRKLAIGVGRAFGLDIYGIDVVDTPQGPIILDINDFPSFGLVPRGVARISEYILHAATRAETRQLAKVERQRRRSSKLIASQPVSMPVVAQDTDLIHIQN